MIEQEDKLIISAIQPHLIDIIWPRIEPMIEAAIAYSNDELSSDVIKERAEAGACLILVIYENDNIIAALTLEKRSFDSGKKILNITTAGGADLHLWMDDFLNIADGLAEEHGCDEVYIIGRKGWQRILSEKGFGVVHTVLSRKLEK